MNVGTLFLVAEILFALYLVIGCRVLWRHLDYLRRAVHGRCIHPEVCLVPRNVRSVAYVTVQFGWLALCWPRILREEKPE